MKLDGDDFMNIIKWIENYFYKENDEEYLIVLGKMNSKLEQLKNDYNVLLEFQDTSNFNLDRFMNMKFQKKDKYIEEMEEIKYKDYKIIKEHNLIALKYNILIELYIKVVKYISIQSKEINLMFQYDNFNQPTAIISHKMKGEICKILIIKNTIFDEQFVLYKLGRNITILEESNFENPYHLEMLKNRLNMLI